MLSSLLYRCGLNAERRALFVGLWPATIWLIGDSLVRHEATAGARIKRRIGR
jgi:hypothetical protein